MKIYILQIVAFFMSSICFAQENKDSIQICYSLSKDAIGGFDHCLTIYFEDNSIFCKRICYSKLNNIRSYYDAELELNNFEEARKQAVLRHYRENSNYLVLDERVEINKSQFDELLKIIDEIKLFVPKGKTYPDEIIISTAEIRYLINDKNGITFVIDWNARYDRSRDIEKALGLKSYLRCPCVEEDLKQMNNRGKNKSIGKRIFSDNRSMNGQIHELQVRNFSEIPKDLLENIDKMGEDNSLILNEYEGRYFNFIFIIDPQEFNLVGKKVGFLGSKIDYFKDTHERFYRNSTTVGGSGLYIFDTTQKVESGGYDAAIVYWSKFLIPIEEVVKRLKNNR